MYLLTILIVSTSLGSVILDSNIQELCSKKYFDTIYVNKSSDGNTILLLERMKASDSKSSPKAVHSWVVLAEEQNGNFKPLDISYTQKRVKNYSNTHFRQPKECPIDVTTVWADRNTSYSKTINWELNDFFITNNKTEKKGKLKVEYVGPKLDIKLWRTPPSENLQNDPKETYIESSQLSSISMIAVLCKASDKSLYAIVEEEPPNASNRKQFVARLMVKNVYVSPTVDTIKSKPYIIHFRIEFRFWLELMNHSIVEFLGIDCEEGSQLISTDTLFVMFWALLVLAIILSIADTGLIIRRNTRKPEPEIPSYRRASRFGPLLDLMENKR